MTYPKNVGIKAMEIYVPAQDKPDWKTEFPVVNGHESITCYIRALDGCYKDLIHRAHATNGNSDGDGKISKKVLDLFDYMEFHTPNCKLVSKSYRRLKYNDYLRSSDPSAWEGIPNELRGLSYDESLKSKILEKPLVAVTESQFKERIEPCIVALSLCGNMYTGSLYCSLISLISNIDLSTAEGKVISMFSYGSGAASTLFALKVTGGLTRMVQKIDSMARLEQRHISTPEEYELACDLRLKVYGKNDYTPAGDITSLLPGTFYVDGIDEAFRRTCIVKKN